MQLPTGFTSEPRRHRDPSFLAAKQARLREPHISPINDLVDHIAAVTGHQVPYVDPDSGGTTAQILLVLQAPARAAAHGSGMLSPDNDDATAANIWRAYRDSGLPRTAGLPWNAVPWYVGTDSKLGDISQADVAAGRQWLLRLLELTPDVKMLITFGRDAEKSVLGIRQTLDQRGIVHQHSIHPSTRNYNSRREQTTREVSQAFDEAARIVSANLSGGRA